MATTSNAPTCTLIRAGEGKTYSGKQQLSYFEGISAQSAGSHAICMHLLTVPPGGRARVHLHEHHETAIYLLAGEADAWYGEGLRERLTLHPGDFLYIPAGMPHVPINRSQTEPCTAIIARTDPNEQESVLPLPELEERAAAIAAQFARETAAKT